MKWIKFVFGLVTVFLLFSCEKNWTEHYEDTPETVDRNMWDVLQEQPEYTDFVNLVRQFEYDTLFEGTDVYTLFIPDNDAMQGYTSVGDLDAKLLDYHFSLHYIQSQNIKGKQRIQTRSEKFVDLENTGSALYFDEIELISESPLYLNGKYFEISEVADPLPNIFEFYETNNYVFSDYIESLDSVILDKELSRPLGYDEYGNTVYDTVSEIYNEFEYEYFPIREEFRSKAATMVFPFLDEYNLALDEMASFLGGDYISHEDIPLVWQYETLMPYLLEQGVFENRVELEEFTHPPYPDTLKMKNILGDSVYIEYHPVNQVNCSNGYTYEYRNFDIPDTLYRAPQRLEGEHLLQQIGEDRFTWKEDVEIISSDYFIPERLYGAELSNDSMLYLPFTRDYNGQFSVEFNFPNLFPGDFLVTIYTNMYIGGIYELWVNDVLAFTMDYYDFLWLQGVWRGVTGKYYRPNGPFNHWDALVTKTNEYGNTSVRFVYTGPGDVQNSGLVIDYIDFIPLEN